MELSACQCISQHRSIVLQGSTNLGKTFLGCTLGRNACINRVKTRYIRLPDLLLEYGDAVAITGHVRKIQNRYASAPLLILDEWLVSDISKDELHFLFELMERRSDVKRQNIISTNCTLLSPPNIKRRQNRFFISR